ncbi:hypothetical protein CMV_002999 [Castanea mollissima]|uniref:F-box protein n=1 Tax=Castanea mollissima TaxID=60419 RepID=A0A8J4W5M7_9ROSI|nr:hypothetical protein CMV_002999 [Castanea mollissima]
MESDFETQGNKTKRIKIEEESTNRMETLPRDIILNILSGLPISSLLQFSFTLLSSLLPMERNCKELPKSMHNLNQEVVYGFGGSGVHSGKLNLEKFGKGRYTRIRSIISFDLADEKFREVPSPDGNGLSRCNYHLVVLGGCLSAAVYCHYGKLDIWVMEKYGVKESWIKKFNLGNYVPKGFQREMEISYKISRFASKGRFVRVVGLTKDGEFLLEYRSRALVSFDPKTKKAKDLVFPGMPKWYRTIVHVGSLNWIDAFTHG